MRKLHLVGLTTDRDGLIFTARKGSKSGGFIVPLDDTLITAVVEVQAARNGVRADAEDDRAEVEAVPRRPRHQSALTPREMQARLRSGRSIDEVAAEAGVDNDWVARFAVPILAEQAQVVELARGLVYAKPRLGESTERLGPSVMQNLSDRGIFLPDDIADAGWSAFQLHDSVWMVRFRYRSRGRNQEAQWEVDVPAARLLARNRLASDLGYVDAARRRRLAAEEELAEEEPLPPLRRSAGAAAGTSPAGRATARKAATGSTAARRSSAVRAPAPRKTAGPSPARTAGAFKTAAGRATPGTTPARKAGASKTAAGRVTAATSPARKPGGSKTAAGRLTARTSPARKAGGAKPAGERVIETSPARKAPAAKTAGGRAPAGTSSARKSAAPRSAVGRVTPGASSPREAGSSRTAAERVTAGTSPAGTTGRSSARKAGGGRTAAGGTGSAVRSSAVTSRRGSRGGIGPTGNAGALRDIRSTAGRTRKAAAANPSAPAAAPAKVGTPGGPSRAPAGSRPAKAARSGAEGGPPAQTGAVRSAVAQIATARVSASMASAERAPWAGVVGPGSGVRPATRNGNDARTSGRSSSSAGARNRPSAPLDDDLRPAFEPRPLPAGGDPALATRVRKLPTPPPRIEGGTPAVSLPAPRVPSPRQEPIPVERAKRRRLRSR